MVDITTINGFMNTIFGFADTNMLGSVSLMVLFLVIFLIIFLARMGANVVFMSAFIGILLFGLSMFGYTTIGWIGGFGILLLGIMLALGFYRIFQV